MFALHFNHGHLTGQPIAAQVQLALLLHKLAQLLVNGAALLGKLAELLLNRPLQLGKLVALRLHLALLLRIQQAVRTGGVALHSQLALLQLVQLLLAQPQPGLVGKQFFFAGHYAGPAARALRACSVALLTERCGITLNRHLGRRRDALPALATPAPRLAKIIASIICSLTLTAAAIVVKLCLGGH